MTADCLDILHWAETLNLLQMPLAFQCGDEKCAERETHQPKVTQQKVFQIARTLPFSM